jgi:hypothetical protein
MRKYGIKPYRRRSRKWRKKRAIVATYANLLLGVIPAYPHHVWAADFTDDGRQLEFPGERMVAGAPG